MLGRKKRRFYRKLIGWLVLLCLLGSFGFLLFFSGRWVWHLIQRPTILQEDETKYISPPSNEEILFRGIDSKIHLYQTGSKQDLVLTEGPDYAPSWDTDGEGFYFLRRLDADTYTVYYYSLSDQMEKLLSTQEIYTAYDLPDPENTWIRFSHDGSRIILSSMTLGVQIIDRNHTKSDTFFKRKPVSFASVWPDTGIVSRNDRFCLLTTHRSKNPGFIGGLPNTLPLVNQLFLFRTDFSQSTLVDQSESLFFGQSFSMNGYTFAYSKDRQIFYVDSIQSIQPRLLTNGTFPSIKPTQRYATSIPPWAGFNLLNAVVIQPLPSPYEKWICFADNHDLAVYQTDTSKLHRYTDRGKSQDDSLGFQLSDFYLEDVNQDQLPEVLCSWQSSEKALGAERLSQFSLTKQGALREIFRSEKKLRNSWKWEDLNQDGILEVFNLYIDWEGEDTSMLENLTWADIYQVTPDRWILSNEDYPSYYEQLSEKYRSFLKNAIKNPSKYGKVIRIMEDWIIKSDKIAKKQG